ncbi:major facilitator superfamily domain-containing protein [Cytidiella melzeri]|nr:major facilitator superfamily domain-containing protein [Cytidiella melzeri]
MSRTTTVQEATHASVVASLKHANASTGSLAIRAQAQPDSSATTRSVRSAKDGGRSEDIELATLGRSNATQTSNEGIPQPPEPPMSQSDQKRMKWGARLQLATVCWSIFTVGWNDGATGPLLPRIQEAYNVSYAVVSLIFMSNFVGFMIGALANVYIVDEFGFGKAMVLGATIQLVGYAIQSAAPPYPVFLIAFAVNGIGLALQDAGGNAYVASIKDNSRTKMSLLHSIYGTGAFLSPLSSTQFSRGRRWSFQYLTALGITLVNAVLLITVFRFKRMEVALADVGQAKTETAAVSHDENKYCQIFRLKEVHFLATMLLLYVGIGVTIGGWSVTYIINVRGGGSNSGYISSGFFGGVALGRLALLWVTKMLGDRNAVFLYILIAIGLEAVVWRVPSLVGDAVAVSLVGFFLGPLYPIVISHAGKILPHWLFAGAVGWIAGFGQAGSAFVPLITGAIASREGIEVLQPLMLAGMGAMFVLWLIVPGTARRPE